MAGYDFEFYETGRISVTAGQKAFTGTGTAWKIRGCEGALVIVSGAGAVNFVSMLSTDAVGEFRTAWTGPTLANAQYTMWLPSAVAATALANHQRLAEIIATIDKAQPVNANLTALAALLGADNQGLMFTGAGTAGTFFLPPIARSLLNMGGSAGVGKFPYFNSNSSANVADIVGAIASGSLMEVGYNGGWYWRFKNGLQITCAIGGTATINSPAGNIFVNGAAIGPYAHPAAFVEEPFCIGFSHKFGNPAGHSWAASVSRPTTTQTCQFQLFRATASTDIFYPIIITVGRFQ